jgi:hypothetical protein
MIRTGHAARPGARHEGRMNQDSRWQQVEVFYSAAPDSA